jgi:glycosyltransferase involved in cell wall biosynthesis
LVSVLMTSYNREKFIAEAIESVLSSTYTNFELIVVDDGSADETVAIAKSYSQKDPRVQVHRNEKNLGDYHNRNKAASYASGKYIKYLDSDDLMYKHTLQVMVDFMEQFPETAYGVSSSGINTKQPFPHRFLPETAIRHHFFEKNFLDCAPTGSIIRTDVFNTLGGFSGKRMIGDLEFGLTCAARYPVMILPPGLVFWREHGNQEVFYGINNNMYEPMTDEFLAAFFKTIPENVLTAAEIQKIWENGKKNKRKALFRQKIKRFLNIQ